MEKEKKSKINRDSIGYKVWLGIRTILIIVIAIGITAGVLYIGGKKVIDKYVSPVDEYDATPIEFVISEGWGASTIAKHLYEACGEGQPGLIRNKAVFKIYVDFMGKSKELQAGKYYLSKNMDIPTIIDSLCQGGESTKSVRITIPEGTTIEGIADILIDNGMYIDKKEFLKLCKTGEDFTNYTFINNVVIANEERTYALEGYLFPDTYDFYYDSSSQTVIDKMLKRFNDVVYGGENSYENKAQEMGMSVDELIALASVIEKESVLETDFYRVSAVFHNRLAIDMKLQSDAPIAYILKSNKVSYSSDELMTDSPYNTYVYKGVPIGAICNPGKTAIDAAANPDVEYRNAGYLFFCLMDREHGNVYAKTSAEHEANVEKYRKNWD